MNAELIAVGTEILLGQIVNTDAQVISQGLSELGINVYYQTVVGDNKERLERAILEAKERADIIITTGGLGPTLDDLTKETLAEAFGKTMVLHEESLKEIKSYFEKSGKQMTPNNEKQAWLPQGCTVFKNEWGTAPACAFEADGKYVIMLPGPPRECEPMFKKYVMPFLYPLAGGCIKSHNVRMFGIGESAMETKLYDLMSSMENPTIAPYAKTSECFVRITAKAETEDKAEQMLKPVVENVKQIIGDDVYGVDVDSLEQVVGQLLIKNNMTLAVAESCTGGLLSKRITDLAGASAYYLGGICSYSNEVKMNLLGVRRETLEKYGAVSEQTAEQMARGICKRLGSDVGVGITGIAGPDGGTEEKPVGLVYISVCINGKVITRKTNNGYGRDRVRNHAASLALDMIRRQLQDI